MAIQYFLTNTTSDLAGGANFNLVVSTTSVATATSAFSCAANATEADFAWTVLGAPGSAGLSTGTFTIKRVITAAHANLRFNVGVARVNATGVVQAGPVMSTEDAGGTGTKTWNIVNPALGTWVSGDRLRVTYQTRNVSTGSRSWTETIGGTAVTVDTPFTASLILTMPVATGTGSAVAPTLPEQNVFRLYYAALSIPDPPSGAVTLVMPVATGTGVAIPPGITLTPSTAGAIQHTLLWYNIAATSSTVPAAAGTGAAVAPNLELRLVMPVALGTGQAVAPTIAVSVVTSPATGTGMAPEPLSVGAAGANLFLLMPVATGTGDAVAPTSVGFTGLQLVMPVATGTGAALSPAMQLVMHPAQAIGSGQAWIPNIQVRISPARATGTGTAPVPLLTLVGVPFGWIQGKGRHKDRITASAIMDVDRVTGSARDL